MTATHSPNLLAHLHLHLFQCFENDLKMAATLLDLLLQGEICPRDLILWLDGASVVRGESICLCFSSICTVFKIVRSCSAGERVKFEWDFVRTIWSFLAIFCVFVFRRLFGDFFLVYETFDCLPVWYLDITIVWRSDMCLNILGSSLCDYQVWEMIFKKCLELLWSRVILYNR